MMPQRFYVQLSTYDFHMLVVPPCFEHALREWVNIPLPRNVTLSSCHFCDEWVQVTNYGGQMVFSRNRPQTVYKYTYPDHS
jgi:hypothetical protein